MTSLRRRVMRCCLAILACCFAAVAQAQSPSALDGLAERLDQLQSMTARFSQTVWSEEGEPLQSAEGEMAVKRGNRLRWEIQSPYAYLIVTDGETLWRFDADLEQAVVQPFRGELADTPALIFSSDRATLAENYRVESERGKEGTWFLLTPRGDHALFRTLRVQFDNGAVTRLELIDNLDQRTEIQFHDVQANPLLADKLFSFEPPPGADVIRDGVNGGL